MKRSAALLTLLLLVAARFAHAEAAMVPDPSAHGSQIETQAHFGVATTPFDVSALHQAKGQAFAFLAAARSALSEPLQLQLRVPFVLGSVAQPAGSYVDASALGNPQLGAQYRFFERKTNGSVLTLLGSVAVGLPLASHDQNLMPNRLLAIADAIVGRGHPEWFTPGVAPITASSALRWAPAPWFLEAELRLPLLVRVSDADLPSASSSTNPIGFASVAQVEARWRMSQRLSLASAAQLFFDFAPAVEHVASISRVQDFERLSLFIHFGSSAALVVDVQSAIGGELGGSTVAGGLRAAVNIQ